MCQQLEHELSLCHRNLILLLSSLSLLEGRCHSSPGDCQHINLLFHTRAFNVIALRTVWALVHITFVFLLLGIFLGTLLILWRLLLVSPLLRCLFSFIFAFWIHPQISSNQSLILGWFDGAHHHQLVLFLCERFHEICKARNLPGSSCEFCAIEGRNKDWVVKA